ncbi:class A beta-lactamase [Arenivirga flava]|uniref:class A beta-lactamase n=1 Tax=Arenivirga flava TaxID=1930060 RepID=UPI0024E08259|nr:class A beta-lactamase [Arenivirga flava]
MDTGTGDVIEYAADERFGYASTHKALSAAAVLAATTPEEYAAEVPIEPGSLVEYSPITQEHVGGTMTLAEIADAAVRYSDNAAGNVLLDRLGGPEGFEQWLRGIGDETTLPDRRETELNDVAPGDDRDTSTPRALATSLRAVAVDDALDEDDRETLVELLVGNTTGDDLIRAGLPDGWTVGDKTGSAAYGTRNDIAVAWPAEGEPPLVLAVLSQRGEPDADHDDELIAEAARLVVGALG